MRNSIERANDRANAMLDVVAHVVWKATGVAPDELKSKSCMHRTTKARFIFVDLCNGVISPASLISEYLSKNSAMISYYKKAHNDCYAVYSSFREMSDRADAMLTELLTTVDGTFGNVFQEEGE